MFFVHKYLYTLLLLSLFLLLSLLLIIFNNSNNNNNNNNNFPICYLDYLYTRHHSHICKEDVPSIFTCPAHIIINVHQVRIPTSMAIKGKIKERFYLTMHSTHFILRLYGVRHIMVKDHSDSERGNLLPPDGLLFPIFLPSFMIHNTMFNIH